MKIRWLLIIIGIAALMWGSAKLISPGSYANAETYTFKCDEDQLIEAVKKLKAIHPEYIITDTSVLQDGRSDSLDYWYHIYFYIPSNSTVINTWARQDFDGTTTFAFVGILYNPNDHFTHWNWKYINNDFSWSDNRKELRQFEANIVEPLHKIVGK